MTHPLVPLYTGKMTTYDELHQTERPSKLCRECDTVALQAHAQSRRVYPPGLPPDWMPFSDADMASIGETWVWAYRDDLCWTCRDKHEHPYKYPCEPRLYAAWFSRANVLKIGKTTQRYDPVLLANTRQSGKISGGSVIWTKPGDVVEESFMQVFFQLRGYQPWHPGKKRTRHAEWLSCPDDTDVTLIEKLNRVYAYMLRIKNDGLQ